MGVRVLCVPYRSLDRGAEHEAFFRHLEEGSCLQPWSSQETLTLVVPAGRQHSRTHQSWELLEHSGNNFLAQMVKETKRGNALVDLIPKNLEELARSVKDEGQPWLERPRLRVLREKSRAKSRIINTG